MCGICGIVALSHGNLPDISVINRMMETLSHRGPDAEGRFRDNHCLLGHKRLSIIDLQSGDQPMSINDGRFQIVYNGEIYNFKNIRKSLEKSGETFQTRSDTEVIIKAYVVYGHEMLQFLNGIFSLAIWDRLKKVIFLARDHLGIKPLYYSRIKNYFIFGSEIKSIFASGVVSMEVNSDGIFEYLCRQSPPYLETMFKDVFEVEPGTWLKIDHQGNQQQGQYFKIESAWRDIDTKTIPEKEEKLCETLGEKIQASIKRQLVSDVPVGISLSSGIDSSLIFHFMKSIYNTEELHAFTYANDDNGIDESAGAALMVSKTHMDIHHHIRKVSMSDNLKMFNKACQLLDSPVSFQSSMPILYLSMLAKEEKIKVLMSGQGADELFLGYARYKRWQQMLENEADAAIWANHFYFGGGIDKVDRVEKICGHSRDIAEKSQAWQWIFKNWDLPPLKRMGIFDQRFRLLYLLKRDDRMGMGGSVEIRVPILDKDFMVWANALPDHWKIKEGNQKYILRKLASSLLPGEVAMTPKIGSPTSIQRWLKSTDFIKTLKSLIKKRDSFTRCHLHFYEVNSLISEHEKNFNFEHLTWCLFSLESWYKATFSNPQYLLQP